jgi:metal-responsive CopG/Arc/MetJ family transcriptional regulator
VILSISKPLLGEIDAEKERTGSTRTATVTKILEKYFTERQERQKLYDEWFIAEVNRGLHSLKTEPLHDHEDVMREVHELLEAKRLSHASKVV